MLPTSNVSVEQNRKGVTLDQNIDEDKFIPSYTIQNVVASVVLDQSFNLDDIHDIMINTEYNPKKFPGLVYRTKRPKTSTLIFSTGKMVCTGAKSSKNARKAVRKVVRDLKKNDIIVLNEPKITIQNMVASGALQKNVDLELAADLLENVMYEPEQFPGLILRMRDPKTVILIFSSGKYVCTGAKNEAMIQEATQKLHEELTDYALYF